MLVAIVRSALRAAGWVVLLAVLVLALGVQRLFDARYDVFPDFVPAQATVQVEAPGLTALQVEQRVAQPIENAVNGTTAVETVRSQSIQGLAVIDVVFREGSDPFRDRQLLAERVSEAAANLPAGVDAPSLSPMTSSTMDLLKIGLISDRLDPLALRDLADWTVKPRLLAVPGVADAIVFGGGVREWEVRVHPGRLAAYGLTLEDVRMAAAAASGVRGAGYMDTPSQRVVLEADGGLSDPAQLGRTVLTRHAGRNVTLADVASVDVDAAPAFGDARIDGRPGILVAMTSQYGSNTLEVTRAVEKALDDLKPMLAAQGVTLVPALHRPATFVEVALANMRDALAFGAALVLLVLVLFLKDWRTALISFVSIPLSLALAVLALRWFGWTINTMTLGGLAVALGVVVDDAIIDVENIDRRLRTAGGAAPRLDTILAASLEVRRPVVLATVVVGLVFVPILLLPGLQGSFFAPLAGAFLLATFASLLVALTVTPALCLWLLRPGRRHREPRWLKRMKLAQYRLLERALPHGRALLVAALVVGALAVAALPFFGAQLLPEFREGHFVLQITGPSGATLAEMDRIGERISRGALAIPGVASVSLQMGRAEAVQDTWPPNRGELHVELKPGLAADAQVRIEEALRRLLDGYPGLGSEVVTFLGDRISESLSGETAPVTLSLYGSDLDRLDALAAQAQAIVQALPGAGSVRLAASPGVPTIRIAPDPDRLSARGLRMTEVLDAIAAAHQGVIVGEVYRGVQPVAIRLTLDNAAVRDPEAVGALLLPAADGQSVPLSEVAAVDLVRGRASVQHEGGRRRLVLGVTPSGPDVVGFQAMARAALHRRLKLPAGYYVEFGGAARGAVAAQHALLLHSALAGAAIIVLLLLSFPDRRSVALILANVPFALVGGVIAAALAGGVLSIGALVGFVTLFGIAARNTILLIAHYEHLVTAEGAHWNRYTVLRGARERLTPILMTALVTALGLLPLALGSGEPGREVEGPMAIVILGGLLSSTVLNLLVMPALAGRYLRPVTP
ncbi:efflux RND transporter permease subunit [Frateuria soli]|uniref:efflux RND transporter permease subunit n=1 Tax=Frateuria soli TaxID=1542730 RepID=UPI001E526E54|nr:efflux RND transporter permease subunit [Frateuria soli]UGB38632.1 efflux RND transporter permease subunit [Frateuria soli]